MFRSKSIVFWMLFFTVTTQVNAGDPTFIGLGDLPGGRFESRANGISADGSAVVGYSYSGVYPEAFRWTRADGMVGLGDLPGGDFRSVADAVSADGSVVVGYSNADAGLEAFRWNEADGMVGLGDLPGGDFSSGAYGVSADGSVIVGGGNSDEGPEAFRWTEADGMVGLGDLNGGDFYSIASGVSPDGSVVIGNSVTVDYLAMEVGHEAFRWTEERGMVGLGDLYGGGHASYAYDLSDDGTVVVGASVAKKGRYEAFRWTLGYGMFGMGFLPGTRPTSKANGISADGSVIVGEQYSWSGWDAFIQDDANGMRSLTDVLEIDYGLDLTGWTLERAMDVSADGTAIVGYGTNPDGRPEAWLAVLPEPSILTMVLLGSFAMAIRRRR